MARRHVHAIFKGGPPLSKTRESSFTLESVATGVPPVIREAAAAAAVEELETPEHRRRLMDIGALEPFPPKDKVSFADVAREPGLILADATRKPGKMEMNPSPRGWNSSGKHLVEK